MQETQEEIRIKVQNINFYYGEKQILKDITLDIYKNKCKDK
jgi:ABC-type phosphate transport system ATPase subunit